ncbi:hypothetical protein CAPTEDRAFT_193615 [Capitella teleta]|uniref:Uncharacterized protein n=1 Tax=Capitella teleta TaxID=283909 RepID=R7VBL5_CAPTE|nr:hypothetical protein CAPTEDRAFT_193615 [Capitella teleta]|eukprot:ELU15962.1 hypothetical protein CAPTEDRAFT_193615 [Capitella teleta]
MSLGRSLGKRFRANLIETFQSHPCHQELDVLDRSDHIKVVACSSEVATWWLGRFRAAYPQDHLSGDRIVKLHPEAGVTLQINRDDGTLRIKGRNHLKWFESNFRAIVEDGSAELSTSVSTAQILDKYLRMNDEFTVPYLLRRLPPSGALKHGPTYIYRLWRGLLDHWVESGDDVYIVTPHLDAKRLADAILILAKHRLAMSRLHVFTVSHCDGENKYNKVLKDAKEMTRDLKGPNKKRLLSEERLNFTLNRLEAKFGRFRCKLIAVCRENHAEVMMTSASFHHWCFENEGTDSVAFFKLSAKELIQQYLAPLGLEHSVFDSDQDSVVASTSSHGDSTFETSTFGDESLRPASFASDP